MEKNTTTAVICPVCQTAGCREEFICRDCFVTGESFPVMICDNCGFRLTGSAPPIDKISLYYQSEEYISHSDTKKGLTNRAYHLIRELMLVQKRKIITRNIGFPSGEILDVGAGTGYFLRHMQRHGWKVTGTEQSQAARHYAATTWDLKLLHEDALFKLPGSSFDVITLWHVLEHLCEPGKYLQKLAELLKSGGLLLIALPNPASTDATHYGKYWAAWDVPRHLWHFTPGNLRQMVENHGFHLRKIYRMPFDAFYVSMLSEKYKKQKEGTDLSKRDRFLILLKGIFWGKISWIISLFRPRKCSSLIYLFIKKS